MEATEYMVKLMNDFVSGRVEPSDFAQRFDDYFIDHQDDLEEDPEVYDIIESLREKVEYYQPDPKIREGYDYLIDDKQLLAEVQRSLKRMEKVAE